MGAGPFELFEELVVRNGGCHARPDGVDETFKVDSRVDGIVVRGEAPDEAPVLVKRQREDALDPVAAEIAELQLVLDAELVER